MQSRETCRPDMQNHPLKCPFAPCRTMPVRAYEWLQLLPCLLAHFFPCLQQPIEHLLPPPVSHRTGSPHAMDFAELSATPSTRASQTSLRFLPVCFSVHSV